MKYAVFILSHSRYDKVATIKTLRKHGYTGKIYVVVDNLDIQLEQYKTRFKDSLIIFDKRKYMSITEKIYPTLEYDCVTYARNAVWDIAEEYGLEYFCVLDDDYKDIRYRAPGVNQEGKQVLNDKALPPILDELFPLFFNFLDETNVKCICFSQSGDYAGGTGSKLYRDGYLRKIMNFFFFKTGSKIKFKGELNEDATATVEYSTKGNILLTVPIPHIIQNRTQQNSGGLTEIYKKHGTLLKTLQTIIRYPASVTLNVLKEHNSRIHHTIKAKNTYPQIISDKYQKQENMSD